MKRIIVITLALIFGLIGLGMSLCGGGFLFVALEQDLQRKSNEVSGVAFIAVPALLIGLALVVVCFRALLKQSKNDPPP